MKATVLAAFIAAYLVAGVASMHIQTHACEGDKVEAGKVNFVDISPCASDPCLLTKHSTYELTISFETGPSPAIIKTATTHFYAVIEGIKVPWPGFNHTNACKDSGLSCPLEPNHPYLYSIPLYINSPVDITVPVEARIVDDATSKDLFCQLVVVKVVG